MKDSIQLIVCKSTVSICCEKGPECGGRCGDNHEIIISMSLH